MEESASSIGASLLRLVKDQNNWSKGTFGTVEERGPVGALRHMAKEILCEILNVDEEDFNRFTKHASIRPDCTKTEYADCLILLIDSCFRSDITMTELITLAQAKMEVNKLRNWPKPKPNQPVEHIEE